MAKKCVPQVRFREYSDEWKQLNAGLIFVTKDDRNHSELPVLAASQELGMVQRSKINYEISYDKKNATTYKRVMPGEFVIHLRSFQGGFAHSETEGITSPAYTVMNFKEKENHDDYYWKYVLSSATFIKRLGTVTYGIRDGRSISYDDFSGLPFSFPEGEEQRKIGELLSLLIQLITQEQAKHVKLQNLKRSMLEKLFPKDGADVPEIRFNGFTAAWEQRKLGEIVERYMDMVPTPRDGYWRLGVRSHAKGTFTTYVSAGKELGEAELCKVIPDNLIVNIVFAWEHAVSITKDDDAKALVSHRFPQFKFREGMVPGFFKYAILDERFRHHLWLASPSGAGRNKTLSIDEMLKYEFIFPKKDEQERIALFLSHLDNLFTLHQQELEKLQNLKKALLERMFV